MGMYRIRGSQQIAQEFPLPDWQCEKPRFQIGRIACLCRGPAKMQRNADRMRCRSSSRDSMSCIQPNRGGWVRISKMNFLTTQPDRLQPCIDQNLNSRRDGGGEAEFVGGDHAVDDASFACI